MVRGHAKQAAQEAAAKRAKSGKGTGKSQIGEIREAGLKYKCGKCMLPIATYKAVVDHYASKHPKEPVPTEASFA